MRERNDFLALAPGSGKIDRKALQSSMHARALITSQRCTSRKHTASCHLHTNLATTKVPLPLTMVQAEAYILLTRETHDTTKYYEDGSAVFVVDGILFKLQASLVLGSRASSRTSETGRAHHPTRVGILSQEVSESSDNNPVFVPNITASQFRSFLLVVLGLPSDPNYLSLLTDAQNKKHNQDLLTDYLDISCVARQFGMSELENWARSQLSLVLESMYSLALEGWDKATLLRLSRYAKSTGEADLISSVTTFIQYFVSISANSQGGGQKPPPSNLDTCVQLYKDPDLPNDNPALFGCVFASILSLGHRSTI